MPRRFNDNYFNSRTRLSPDTFNPVIADFDKAIAALEEMRIQWQEQVGLFNANALKRVNDAVAPIIQQISSAIDGGFLVAETDDFVAIVEGQEINFFIPSAARVAYRPTPFLAIMAPDVYDDWAIGRTVAYNTDTGLLTVEILHLNGSGAQRSGWVISASSGVVEAVSQWLDEITALHAQVAGLRDEVNGKLTLANNAKNAAAQSATEALGYRNSANGAANAASGFANNAEESADEAATTAAALAAQLAANAGGPVVSINQKTGIVTGMLEQAGAQDITGLKTIKRGAANAISDWLLFQPTDYGVGKPRLGLGKKLASTTAWSIWINDGNSNAGTLDFDLTGLTKAGKRILTTDDEPLAKSFVASGAIAAGQYVALRSDGKVEVVSGSETYGSLGADVTITSAGIITVLAVAHNAATSKIAIFYYTSTSSTHMVVIGTVAGDTITFGTSYPVLSGQSNLGFGAVTWNAAGTVLAVAFRGASGYLNTRIATVSGVTLTFGATTNLSSTTADGPYWIFHDDSHGSRLIFVDLAAVRVATYTGTTITAQNNSGMSGGGVIAAFWDEAQAKLVVARVVSGDIRVQSFTISGASASQGTALSFAGIFRSVCYDKASGKAVVFYAASNPGPLFAVVISTSGITSTLGTPLQIGDFLVSAGSVQSLFDMDSGRVLVMCQIQASNTTVTDRGFSSILLTVSGATLTATTHERVKGQGRTLQYLLPSTSGPSRIAAVYSDSNSYDRWFVLTGRIVNGKFVVDHDMMIKSTPPFLAIASRQAIISGWQLFDAGAWSISQNNLIVSTMTLPAKSTNADAWIGVAKATVANAASVEVALRGGIDRQRSGMTPGQRYYLGGDGTLSANDNGREAGIALSATELLMEAA